MKKYNKGEWAEVFCVLYILLFPNISVVDCEFKVISNNIFNILKVCYPDAEFYIQDNYLVRENNEVKKIISIEEVNELLQNMQQRIINEKNTTFSFEEVDKIFDDINIKGSSKEKEDIIAKVEDKINNRNIMLSYSIKSFLGNNPTLLNASGKTNFKYQLLGERMNDDIMKEVNNTQGRTKLIDRMNILESNNIKLEFDSICNDVFERNLKMCDSDLPNILSVLLLYYYKKKGKRLFELVDISNLEDKEFVQYKIKNFLFNFMASIFPGKKWNGIQEVTGGILAVIFSEKYNMSVKLLDIVYYKEEVLDYLYNYSYFETPSTTRYNMLEVFKEDDKYFCTLNLQIRLKEPK